ncbi:Mgat1 [Symbiodinium natans]|uniref:alpha-1,3-mannosyl-glycoprotein 2-beta-N-acetylglucosaminyltransferase n=1 Tax=Symbiodinium natans TaxID=878477 RepID=A0A812V633_9DINO|nr:Mgat1 [Symbiodinium natans]
MALQDDLGRLHRSVCARCSGRVNGPVPTTLPDDVMEECQWKELQHSGFADANVSSELHHLADAKALCLRRGDRCQGVSCDFGNPARCHLVKGKQLTLAGHATHVKECLSSGVCQHDRQSIDSSELLDLDAVIVVLAHNRESDLADCLTSLLSLAHIDMFKLHVSLDDAHHYARMADVVAGIAKAYNKTITTMRVPERENNFTSDNAEQQKWFQTNTGKIAHHYWAAFEQVFMVDGFKWAIFVEEDLVFAPDFLALFISTWQLLQKDHSLWCVSGWNDAGFTFAVSDQCRLFRTSYFPGLGFMLPQQVWLKLREEWPSAPTMGWDYWMRTAFRRSHKECIVPEVPRSRHFSHKGSSITQDRQVEFFQSMALANLVSSCVSSRGCNHFGNLSYLMQAEYETWILRAIQNARPVKGLSAVHQVGQQCEKEAVNLGVHDDPDLCAALVGLSHCSKYFMFAPNYPNWGCRCCQDVRPLGKAHVSWSLYEARGAVALDPKKVYIVPYVRESFMNIAPVFGLVPLKMTNVIPPDVRAEHHGLVFGRHVVSQAVVIFADKRSDKPYLPQSMRVARDMDVVRQQADHGESCDSACAKTGRRCDAEALHSLNNCPDMEEAFGCKYCAHQVGQELPAYVVDKFQPTVGQCLVTFISQMSCQARHPATRRLCACAAVDKPDVPAFVHNGTRQYVRASDWESQIVEVGGHVQKGQVALLEPSSAILAHTLSGC